MKLARTQSNNQRENTIPLINVVFLMLVFFLIAGTIAPMNDDNINPVRSLLDKQVPPEQAISIRKDGTMYFKGNALGLSDVLPSELAGNDNLIVFPDRETEASIFIETITKLRQISGKKVSILIERKNVQ